jgi:hypothetical protein
MKEPGGAASWVFSNLHSVQTPTLSPLSGLIGKFQKLSRGFFFWTSPIEPCQEKIISRQGSRLFAGEQKEGEEEGCHSFLALSHPQRMPLCLPGPLQGAASFLSHPENSHIE